jgi:hypothetical protein
VTFDRTATREFSLSLGNFRPMILVRIAPRGISLVLGDGKGPVTSERRLSVHVPLVFPIEYLGLTSFPSG